jgi:tape measure domain-containing protein
MSNQDTELLIRIRADLGRTLSELNQVTGGFNGVGSAAQRATGSIHPMMLALSSPSTRAAEALAATARGAAAARAEIERTAAAELSLASASRGLATDQVNLGGALSSSFSGSSESVGATSAAIAGLKSQLLGLVAVYKLLEGGKAVVEKAADLQDNETRLKSLTGTAEKYAETEQYLTETAGRMHKEYLTLADSYTRLLALQKSGIITQKESRLILEGMADKASELGVSNADLALSMRGVIQQLGNSNVQWDEMRQATDSIPGLLQSIAKASGMSVSEMKALAETGAYTTAMFRDHFIKALEESKGASERLGNNIHATYTDISNAYAELVKVLEEPISDALTPMLKGIAHAISQVANGPSLQDKINELEMLKAASSKDAPRFLPGAPAVDQDEIRRRRGATSPAQPDRIAVLTAEIEAIKKRDAANKDALERQDQQEKADRQASEAKKGLADTEDWYAETVIADEKKVREAKEASSKKAQSAAESAAKAYASEREAVAKNIEQLNFELAALKLSDNERAIQTKVRSLSAKATDDERSAIEAKVRALDKETTAQQRQQAMWEQSVKDANAAYDQRKSNADMIKFGDVQGGFNDALIKTREQLDHGIITPEQFKAETEKLGRAYNENFIDPAKSGVSQLSEFSVQAARNMQSAFADFLFDPFENGMEGMAANFAKIVQRMVAEAASAQIFETLLGKNYGQSNATGGLLSALFSGVAGAVGGAFGGGEAVSVAAGNSAAFSNTMTDFQWMPKQFHTGGIIGQGGRSVNADPAIFSSATRYHSGGIPGLKPNEVPIIALNNEEVLTADDPRHRNNLSKTTANGSKLDGIDITTHVTVAADNQSAGDMGNKLGDMVNAAVRQVIVTEKRPGGLLAKGS